MTKNAAFRDDTLRAAIGGAAVVTVVALGYRQALRWLGMWPNALSGAVLGLAHAAGTTALVTAASYVQPRYKRAGLKGMGPFAYGPLTVPGIVLGHVLFGAMVGWIIGREPRRAVYVSPAFLRWLRRQEEADHVEQHPAPIRPRLRTVPESHTQSDEPAEWVRPARAA
jgi:hypothetical protein